MRRSPRWVSWVALVVAACHDDKPPPPPTEPRPAEPKLDPYASDREHMVRDTIAERGVRDERVLEAMRSVPRHEFVPIDIRDKAYEDRPQPIGFGLTISQPYIVATMTEAAQLHPGDRVLEIGTGSGYQAAVLAELSAEVYTIEIVDELAKRAQKTFERLGLDEIHTKTGDGYDGWPDAAPFDAILVTAAPPTVPPPLLDQLRVGGRLIAPVGSEDDQQLEVFTRTRDGIIERKLMDVRFGPMTGKARSMP